MSFLKYALVASSLLVPALCQDEPPQPVAQITPGAGPGGSCDGCYVVADVAAVVFGSEFVTQIDTVVVNIQTGKNGSYSATSYKTGQVQVPVTTIVGQAQLSISTAGGFGGNVYSLDNNPTIVLGSQTLTSPTAYQIFTAFSVTRSFLDERGSCQVSSGTKSILPSGFLVTIPENPSSDYYTDAEKQFIASIGLSCAPGGQNDQSVTVNSGSTLTTTSTSMGPLRFTPVPLSAASVQTPSLTANFPYSTGGNFSTPSGGFSVSPYTGAGQSFTTHFAKATLPLMAVGALSIILVAVAL